MPVDVTARLLDSKEFSRRLWGRGDDWARCVQRTISDMRTRAPGPIGLEAMKVYNAKKASLNPNNKSSRGGVSVRGGLVTLELVYRGGPQPVKSFARALSPASKRRNSAPYKITAEYVKGSPTTIGHWSPPGTEGGRYSVESPRMYIPGVSKYGPVRRVGSGWAGGTFGPSVPQMVMNRGNDERSRERLSEIMATRLEHHMRQCGLV